MSGRHGTTGQHKDSGTHDLHGEKGDGEPNWLAFFG
jgi:hypothetical protein